MKKRIISGLILVAVVFLGIVGIQQLTTEKEDKYMLQKSDFTEDLNEKTDSYRENLEKKYESLLMEAYGFEQIEVVADMDGDSVRAIKVQNLKYDGQENMDEIKDEISKFLQADFPDENVEIYVED